MNPTTFLRRLLAGLFFVTAGQAVTGYAAVGCDDPVSSAEVARCLGLELREADANINRNYTELMGKLDADGKLALRLAQRAWIKDRDATCELDTKESNREKWFQALLLNYSKTVCVTRYTRHRTSELEARLAGASPQADGVGKPAVDPRSDFAYDRQPPTEHASGKWYIEFTLDYAKVVGIEPGVFTLGVWSKTLQSGAIINIRKRDAGKDIRRIGFAVDLDNGKLYYSENGEWTNGKPGSNQGIDIKPRDSLYAGIRTSADSIKPYLESRAIVANYGAEPMAYALPEGYSPWQSRSR
jgi:uncharacterized protein YecT (DUF1311 family)